MLLDQSAFIPGHRIKFLGYIDFENIQNRLRLVTLILQLAEKIPLKTYIFSFKLITSHFKHFIAKIDPNT